MADMHSPYKLLKHLDNVLMWKRQGYTFPVFIDLDITNKCNNKCPLCVTSLISHQKKNNVSLSLEKAKDIITQLSDVGVRAITFAGGGDPSCHLNFDELIEFVKYKGMDIALFTNAYELSDKGIESIVKCCTWMRISLDADSPEIYKKTHGMDALEFNHVLSNINKIVKKRKETGSNIVIGACYLIGPHTIDGIYNATKLCKDMGLDYIRLRPFFEWEGKIDKMKDSGKLIKEIERCKEFESKNFGVSYPQYRCSPENKERVFSQCYVPHFITSVTADAKVYPCCAFKNNEEYCLGDLNKNSFKEIWLSERRKNVHELIDLKKCPTHCQFEDHGKLLWAIKNNKLYGGMTLEDMLGSIFEPIQHSNFL